MLCESVDADGDANIWTATVDPKTGVGSGVMTAGTGKYANLTVKPTFQTIYQIRFRVAAFISLNGNTYCNT